MTTAPDRTLAALRRFLAALFLLGSVGTAAELLLLDHTESAAQFVPLVLLAVGSFVIAASLRRRRHGGLRAIQALMVLFLVSGAIGVVLHLGGNLGLEREMNPGAADLSLMWNAVKGGTPTLAPGTMILLGGLGLAYAYGYSAYRD